MKTLARSFAQGLLIVIPSVATIYMIAMLIGWIDGVFGIPVPGLGLVITLVFILVVGLLASNVVGRKMIEWMEAGIGHLPVVKLVYGSIKDLMGAFVGDKKSFSRPVMVDIAPEQNIKVLGFVTCERFDDPRLVGYVSVYLPQSYNFAGNLIVVPRSQVKAIDADGAQFMAFIVSGGVTEMNAARTMIDASLFDVVKK